jgi:hypothetical protein
MKVIINITNDSSIKYALRVIEELKKDPNVIVAAIVYRNSIKEKINELDTNNLIERIISQSDIGLLDDDMLTETDVLKIQNIEDNYTKKSIWNYVYQDRTLIYNKRGFLYNKGTKLSRNTLVKTILKRFATVEQFFIDFNPDVVLYATQDFGTSMATILYEVANKNDVPIIIPIVAKFNSYFTFNNDIYGPFGELEKAFNDNLIDSNYKIGEDTKLELKDYKSNNDVPFYIVKEKEKKVNFFIKKIKTIFTFAFSKIRDLFKKEKDFLGTKFWYYVFDKITISHRSRKTKRLIKFAKIEDVKKTKYLYFPLHYEPELVLLVQSQDYLDQLHVIQNVSRNLPSNTQLVVKDHPMMLKRREPDFYKTILGIPNVILIDSNENSIEIIKSSFGVITIIGSAGMEGFFYNKPVLTLSDAFFNFLPCVKKVNSYNEIPDALLSLKDCTVSLNEQLILVQTIKEMSIDLNLNKIIRKYDQGNIDKTDSDKLNEFLKFLKEKINREVRT